MILLTVDMRAIMWPFMAAAALLVIGGIVYGGSRDG